MGKHPAWKRTERRLARFFGAERTPLSGSNSRWTHSDSLHPSVYIECKHGSFPKTWPKIIDLFHDTEKKAQAEGKKPVLVFHGHRVKDVAQYPAYVRVELKDGTQPVVCLPLSVARHILLGPQTQAQTALSTEGSNTGEA